MKIINIKTICNKKELENKLFNYSENEFHNLINIFKYYSSNRIGIHAYIKDNSINGYYEDGSRTRNGDLQRAKSRFYIKIFQNKGITRIYGVIFFEPVIVISMLFALIISFWDLFFNSDILSVLGIAILGFIVYHFYKQIIENQKKLYNDLYNLLAKNE